MKWREEVLNSPIGQMLGRRNEKEAGAAGDIVNALCFTDQYAVLR